MLMAVGGVGRSREAGHSLMVLIQEANAEIKTRPALAQTPAWAGAQGTPAGDEFNGAHDLRRLCPSAACKRRIDPSLARIPG